MKKYVLTLALLFAFSGITFADGNAFTPLNFNDTEYGNTKTTKTNSAFTKQPPTSDTAAIGNGNIQNAIQQLENAQVDIRNDLLNFKTKYADVDAQYKLIKAERNTLKQQVRSIERRIRDIDRAKERIKKNML